LFLQLTFIFSKSTSKHRNKFPKSPDNDEENTIKIFTEEEIIQILKSNIPDIENIFDRTGSVPVSEFIISTYSNGLPLFASNPTVQQHTIKGLRFVFHKVVNLPDKTKQSILKRITDAYTACQMEQGRIIDSLYGQLSGRDKSFKDQLLSIVDIQKEQILNQIVNHRNPDAWQTTDDFPEQQIPHLQSSYCLAVGHQLGLRGVKSSQLDNFKTILTESQTKDILEDFQQRFSVPDLIQTIVNDINQQDPNAERLINCDSLSKWITENSQSLILDPHDIFYDEEKEKEYNGKPNEENKYRPFINEDVARDLLFSVFLF
jgi:hypothetical protein